MSWVPNHQRAWLHTVGLLMWNAEFDIEEKVKVTSLHGIYLRVEYGFREEDVDLRSEDIEHKKNAGSWVFDSSC